MCVAISLKALLELEMTSLAPRSQGFGELVEIAADDDAASCCVAGALGDEESGLDIVGGDDDRWARSTPASRSVLSCLRHPDDRLAGANQVIDSRRSLSIST